MRFLFTSDVLADWFLLDKSFWIVFFVGYFGYMVFVCVVEAVVVQGNKRLVLTRSLWVRLPLRRIIYYFFIFSFVRYAKKAKSNALISATQHPVPWKIPAWCSDNLNTRFSLLALLYLEYNINLKKKVFKEYLDYEMKTDMLNSIHTTYY